MGGTSIGDLSEGMRKRLTLAACILGSTIVFVDSTVVTVALPSMQQDLGGGLALQQWVVDAYLLTLGSLILVGGSLGDLFGEKRVFVIGVVASVTGLFLGLGLAKGLNAIFVSLGIDLPQAGIKGNLHMMMMDKNNAEVAGLIQKWLEGKGLTKP